MHADWQDVELAITDGLNGTHKVFDAKYVKRLPLRGTQTVWNMEEVTRAYPRQVVIDLWRKAFSYCLTKLARSKKRHRFLSCHLTLYSPRTSEFYSAVEYSAFFDHDMIPDRVLALIDDVYDMYVRLTAPGQVYSRFYEIYQERALKSEPLPNPGQVRVMGAQLHLESIVAILNQVLAWRRADLIAAETLASQFTQGNQPAWENGGADFAVLGVKHLEKAVAGWLKGDLVPVYLSHPISRPRRQLARKPAKRWNPVVGQFNRLQEALYDEGMLAVMPTAIDEQRIQPGRGLLVRQARLTERWPTPDSKDSLYKSPPADGPEHSSLLRTLPGLPRDKRSSLLRTLEGGVADDIRFRDNLLVARNDHLLVFRPLFDNGEISGGVKDEIRYWGLSARVNPERRISFIHLRDDVLALWREYVRKNVDNERGEVVRLMSESLETRNYDSHQIADVIEDPKHGTLSRGELSLDRVEQIRREILPEVGENYFWLKLTTLAYPKELSERVGLWVLDGRKDLPGKSTKVRPMAAFLRSTAPNPGLAWVDGVQTALGGRSLGELADGLRRGVPW